MAVMRSKSSCPAQREDAEGDRPDQQEDTEQDQADPPVGLLRHPVDEGDLLEPALFGSGASFSAIR